jgi:hypothetical protein
MFATVYITARQSKVLFAVVWLVRVVAALQLVVPPARKSVGEKFPKAPAGGGRDRQGKPAQGYQQ